jgi:hypothetical protein
MKAGDIVIIEKCDLPEYVGFTGELFTSSSNFHANAGILSMIDILLIDKLEFCIGIINHEKNEYFLWDKESKFNVEISKVN